MTADFAKGQNRDNFILFNLNGEVDEVRVALNFFSSMQNKLRRFAYLISVRTVSASTFRQLGPV